MLIKSPAEDLNDEDVGDVEQYFSERRTAAGSHESMKTKWIVTESPANKLEYKHKSIHFNP